MLKVTGSEGGKNGVPQELSSWMPGNAFWLASGTMRKLSVQMDGWYNIQETATCISSKAINFQDASV
jgi:hypothetical protein